MITAKVTSCQEMPSHVENKSFLVAATVYRDGKPIQGITVTVNPWYGEYDYEDELLVDDDEPIQIAIGQYFVDNNIDVGNIGR